MISSRNTTKSRSREAGFTILEFIIATSIFSLLLILVVTAISHFASEYYKADIASSVSTTLQTVSSTIEQSLEGADSTSLDTDGSSYLCTGNEEYLYTIGTIGSDTPDTMTPQHPYALFEFPTPTSSCYHHPNNPVTIAAMKDGQSLLGNHYRLLTFSINEIGGSNEFSVDLKIAYTSGGSNDDGDDSLCSTAPGVLFNGPDGCGPNGLLTNYSLPDLTCRSGSGEAFCDVAELLTNVGLRN